MGKPTNPNPLRGQFQCRPFISPSRTQKQSAGTTMPTLREKTFIFYFPTRTSSNSLQISSEGGAVSSDTTTMHSAENTNAGNSS